MSFPIIKYVRLQCTNFAEYLWSYIAAFLWSFAAYLHTSGALLPANSLGSATILVNISIYVIIHLFKRYHAWYNNHDIIYRDHDICIDIAMFMISYTLVATDIQQSRGKKEAKNRNKHPRTGLPTGPSPGRDCPLAPKHYAPVSFGRSKKNARVCHWFW